jgi:hypothetical protein
MTLEQKAKNSTAGKTEEEVSREYLARVFSGKVKHPSQPLVHHAVSDVAGALLRDANMHRIHRSMDFNYVVALCKFYDYPVNPGTVKSEEFVEYWTRHKDNFTDSMVKKLVPKALGLGERE